MRIAQSKPLVSGILLAILGVAAAIATPPSAPSIEIEKLRSSCVGEPTRIWVSWDHIPTADFYNYYLYVDGTITFSGFKSGVNGFGEFVPTPSDVTAVVEACNNANECNHSFKTIWVNAIPGCVPR